MGEVALESETAATGMGGDCASAVSSIQPVAPLFKSWIWAKSPLRPINRNGRPAGKPYSIEADEDGPAKTSIGRFETRIMPESVDPVGSARLIASPFLEIGEVGVSGGRAPVVSLVASCAVACIPTTINPAAKATITLVLKCAGLTITPSAFDKGWASPSRTREKGSSLLPPN